MEIKELKSRLDIEEVARHLGLEIDSRTHRSCCPFHEDKTPSLQFSIEKQIATCFSTKCDAGTMDVIAFASKKLGKSTHETLNYLKSLLGEVPKTTKLPLKKEKVISTVKKEILREVFSFYQTSLLNSKPAKEYLQGRKLGSLLEMRGQVCGYNRGSFHYSKSEEEIGEYVNLGLLKPRPQGGHYVFGNGSVVFPLKDKAGDIVGLYYRSIKESKVKHLYLKDRSGLYPSYPIAESRKVILTESIIDAATLLGNAIIVSEYTILACYGTEGVQEQYKALSELADLEEVIFMFDEDEAGRVAVKERSEELHKLLPKVKQSKVTLPEGEDVNGLAQGHDGKVFISLLESREPIQQNYPAEEFSSERKKGELDTSNAHKLIYRGIEATYTIQGGIRKELDSMRVTLVVSHPETGLKSRNKLDMYEDKQVSKIASEVGEKLGIGSDLLELDLNYLTDLLDEYRESSESKEAESVQEVLLSKAERERSIAFAKEEGLIERINELIGKSGIVGEEKSRIVLYVIASAYKMRDTLHVLIQGSSGSGKSHLMESVLNLMPEEDVIYFTRVTESSMYNYGSKELQGKILAYEDWDGLEEKAEYAVRELISKGKITSSTSGKDEQSGAIKSHRHTVYGPVTTFACTTHGEIYEDNMNRVFVIAVDESKEQTQSVIRYQNEIDAGIIDRQEISEVRRFLQHYMRIISPCEVVNPYAHQINLPPEAENLRRLNRLFKAFVKQITVLNQYQRERTEKGALITAKEDIATAIDIMFDSIVLKVDELDGSLRLFYEKLKSYVREKSKGLGKSETDADFTQREVRQKFKLSQSQVQRYMDSLTGLEYLQKGHIGARNTFYYKISYWDSLSQLRENIRKHLYKQLEKL